MPSPPISVNALSYRNYLDLAVVLILGIEMHRALPIKGFKIRVRGGEKSSKGLETYAPSSAALLERSTLSLPAQEDISGSRSTWRVEGLDQTVQLKACNQYKNLEKEKLFCRKVFI